MELEVRVLKDLIDIFVDKILFRKKLTFAELRVLVAYGYHGKRHVYRDYKFCHYDQQDMS